MTKIFSAAFILHRFMLLKRDRDWFIFADADHMTGYCTAKKGALFGINVYFPRENDANGYYHEFARKIISSVD